MYRFSLIIPHRASGSNSERFDDTLASVLRYRCDDCQVIVTHDGNYNDPYDLGREVDFVSVEDSRPNLIQLFNSGLNAARGEWIGLLRPGIQLDEGWDQPIRDAFENPDTGSVAPAIVASQSPARLITAGVTASRALSRCRVSAGIRLSSRRAATTQPLGPTSWAAFYRRNLLNALGDCDEQLDPHCLDLDLALSFQSLKFDCVFCPNCVVTIDDPTVIESEFQLAHGHSAQRALTRHRELTASQRVRRTMTSAVTEFLAAPWRPAKLKQAFQRIGAGRLADTDRHHQELLRLLSKQRPRLVAQFSGLSKQTAPPMKRAA